MSGHRFASFFTYSRHHITNHHSHFTRFSRPRTVRLHIIYIMGWDPRTSTRLFVGLCSTRIDARTVALGARSEVMQGPWHWGAWSEEIRTYWSWYRTRLLRPEVATCLRKTEHRKQWCTSASSLQRRNHSDTDTDSDIHRWNRQSRPPIRSELQYASALFPRQRS